LYYKSSGRFFIEQISYFGKIFLPPPEIPTATAFTFERERLGALFEKSSPKPLQKLFDWDKTNIVCAIPVHQIMFYKLSEDRSRPRYLGTVGCLS